MAMASALLPTSLRGTGLGLVVTATSVARIVATIGFGAVWVAAGADVAVVCFAAVLVAALTASGLAFLKMRDVRFAT
jgi:hypothetical protein